MSDAPLDIEALRAQTEGCQHVLHFDNAGASLQPDCVHDAVAEYLDSERRIGGYATSRLYHDTLESFYTEFAQLLNCGAEEIAFVENATRAWDMAFYSIDLQSGDRILTAKSEYVSNVLACLQVAQSRGVIVDVVPDDEMGQLDVTALESMIDDRVKLISITHVPTQGGLVNPAEKIGEIANRHGILYLLDACQSVGQMPVDVKTIGCDMLSGTGRKFLRGPRGTGFLYVKSDLIERLNPPFIDLQAGTWTAAKDFSFRADARRFENWERFFAGQVGLAKAAEYARNLGLQRLYERTQTLAQTLRDGLSRIPGVSVHDLGREKCGIVTFLHEYHDAQDVHRKMAAQHINVSTSTRTSARWDFEDRNLTALTRASVHYFNTDAEIERFCERIERL